MVQTRMDNTKKYSQNNEQFILDELATNAGITAGHLLDIGAYLPDTFSNSRALIDKGWSGVLVEPSPVPFQALLAHYKDNPKITLVNAAVGVESKWLDFYDSNGDALSSSNVAHVLRWTQNNGVKFTKFAVKSVAISDLFAQFGFEYDVINIDVESQNAEIFYALPWHCLPRTRIICVEHDGCFNEMQAHLSDYGFVKTAMNFENIIFSRNL
jgi:FkbM family methyltransferase